MVRYSESDIIRRSNVARYDGIKLSRKATMAKNEFHASSSRTEGEAAYFVRVGSIEDGAAKATCTCAAGMHGSQCKHGAAAISALRLSRVKNAARILSEHGKRVRAASAAR